VSTDDADMGESEVLGLLLTARSLAADAVCTEVVRAWNAEGIESILLKGPTLADWLYPGELRSYVDIDLFVAPDRLMDGATILTQLGFAPFERHVSLHAHPWLRAGDGAEVDLHANLWGPHRPPERVWAEISHWVERRDLGGLSVTVLNLPARALYVTLHAAQHVDGEKQLEDLRRAVQRTPEPAWREAERLADRLGVLQVMADGLARDPAGAALVQRLPLVRACLRAGVEGAPLAIGFERLSQAGTLREKLGVIARSLGRPIDEYGPDRPADPVADGSLFVRIRHALLLFAEAARTVWALRSRRR
jgi:hypothetical protein